MSTAEVTAACRSTRTYLKGRITTLITKVEKYKPENISQSVLDNVSESLNELKAKVDENYQEFLAAAEQDDSNDITVHYEQMQDRLDVIDDFVGNCWHRLNEDRKAEQERLREIEREAKDKLAREKVTLEIQMQERLETQRITMGMSSSYQATPPPSASSTQKPKLPQLALPTFDGKFEEWLPFRDRFNQTVHSRSDLSGAEKFTYLLTALQGKAAETVKSIPISDDNYITAYERITKLFEHTREIAFKLVDSIIDHPAMTTRSSDSIISLTNTTSNALASIKAIDKSADLGELLVTRLVTRKLDQVTLERFNQSLDDRSIPPLKSLLDFLDKEMLSVQVSSNTKPTRGNQHSTASYNTNLSSQTPSLEKKESAERKCVICNNIHPHFKCPKLNEGSDKDRKKIVKDSKLCTNCLSTNHGWKNCKSARTCRTCQQKHHSLLHNCFVKNEKATALVTQTKRDSFNDITKFKPTAVVTVRNIQGQGINCRVLLDNCSDVCLIQERLVQQLGLTKEKLPRKQVIEALQDKPITTATEFATLDLTSTHYPQIQVTVKALIIAKIGGCYPQKAMDSKRWDHIPKNGLADPEFFKPQRVELLLSTDIFYDVIRSGILRGQPGEPVAQESCLGWLVGGGTSQHSQKRKECPSSANTSTEKSYSRCNLTNSLDYQLERFWEVEHGPKETPMMTAEEKVCESHYAATTTRLTDGTYQVELPFKADSGLLGNSKAMAIKRFYALESKLNRNPSLKTQYTQAIQDLIRDDHLEIAPTDQTNLPDSSSYHLPHHAVLKESSSTTKMRIVFDASAKTSTGVSLNEKLMTGPVLQDDLTSILIRWRYWLVPLSADIKQMYLFVNVHPKDRNFLRLFWRSSPNEKVKLYRLRKVTFGTASAPYQAVKTLQRVADDHRQEFSEAAEVLKRDFYVDDCLTGANSTESAIKLANDLMALARKANFTLRKWTSSNATVLATIPEDLQEATSPLSIQQDEATKALGLIWSPKQDEFRFKVEQSSQRAVTKRQILSEIAKVFDPLGFLTPVTITAKIIMQDLWKCTSGWDKQVPEKLLLMWSTYQKDVSGLGRFRLPRGISTPNPKCYQLHGFSDASEKAYAAAVYLRTLTESSVDVRLVASKSRVAPTKEKSLPKLELCGAVLVAQLLPRVKTALSIITTEDFAWTDSTITLAWIQTDQPQKWKTFVRNRVITIQENIPSGQWSHIPGTLNPSDLPSRGISIDEFLKSELWFRGPKFLQIPHPYPKPVACLRQDPKGDVYTPSTGGHNSNPNALPTISNQQQAAIEAELRPANPRIMTLKVSSNLPDLNQIMERYSCWRKLRRHVSWWIRLWKYHIKQEHQSRLDQLLTPLEVSNAEEKIVTFLQHTAYAAEVLSLKESKAIHKKSQLLSLTPFLQNGMLRVGGRISKAELKFDNRHPILLPRHHVTTLIIRMLHDQFNHSGTTLTLSLLQRRFWVIRGKTQVKKVIGQCKTCIIQKANTIQQLMSDLPEPRVRISSPFTHTGVDYAGPIPIRESTRRGAKAGKAYIAVFVCLCTKAVTLELVSDLTTACFLAALRRFTSRRRKPTTIKSDNGTTFVGANNELKELFDFLEKQVFEQEVIRYLNDSSITWSFIPPAAPHMGGIWEAAVKSTKFHLKRVIGKTTLTFEQLDTLLKEVEACLYSRPLCALSSDPNDLTTLTPGHFLTGEPPLALPEPDVTHLPVNRLDRWQHQQQMKQHFWNRWHAEYLQQLQRRTKWKSKERNVQVGDLVVVKDDNHPPQFWKLGRVEEVHPNPDDPEDLIRTVTVRTATGRYKRPVAKLVLLPGPEHEDI